MAVALYMDEQVPGAITRGLRRRGVDVLTAQDDGHDATDDDLILDRAATLGRVIFTRDQDFLVIARARQTNGIPFAGVVFARQKNGPSYGACITDLETITSASEPGEWADTVTYLPL